MVRPRAAIKSSRAFLCGAVEFPTRDFSTSYARKMPQMQARLARNYLRLAVGAAHSSQ